MSGLSILWSPFRILDVELRNRFVMLPHFTSLEQWGGEPSEDHVAYYGARARSPSLPPSPEDGALRSRYAINFSGLFR